MCSHAGQRFYDPGLTSSVRLCERKKASGPDLGSSSAWGLHPPGPLGLRPLRAFARRHPLSADQGKKNGTFAHLAGIEYAMTVARGESHITKRTRPRQVKRPAQSV